MTQKIVSQIHDEKGSLSGKYRGICVGREGVLFFLYYELVTGLLRNMGGAIGLFLRAKCYRPLFKRIGKGVVFGTGVTLRNPRRIELGDKVMIDDNCVLDAKGEAGEGISIGHRVFLSRNVILACKDGNIRVGNETTIGPNSLIHSVETGHVSVGDCCALAAYCYLIGGGDYRMDETSVPMVVQGVEPAKGIGIEQDVWLGAGVHVLDGSLIRRGAVVGAKALVRGELPAYSISVGIPARIKGYRKGKEKHE